MDRDNKEKYSGLDPREIKVLADLNPDRIRQIINARLQSVARADPRKAGVISNIGAALTKLTGLPALLKIEDMQQIIVALSDLKNLFKSGGEDLKISSEKTSGFENLITHLATLFSNDNLRIAKDPIVHSMVEKDTQIFDKSVPQAERSNFAKLVMKELSEIKNLSYAPKIELPQKTR
jgi:hypothetical protein